MICNKQFYGYLPYFTVQLVVIKKKEFGFDVGSGLSQSFKIGKTNRFG
jgi:hypothetical protein